MQARRTILTAAALAATVAVGLGAGFAAGCARADSGATLMLMPENAPGRTGVVRRTDLLVAHARSARHDAQLRALREKRDALAESGDAAAAESLNAYGAEWQEVAHRQLAGEEPLYTVLLGVQEELRAVMRERGLDRVVEAGPGVEGVDITDELVARITPAERNR